MMEAKEELLKNVLVGLDQHLSADQLRQVQLVFTLNLKKYRVEESKNEVIIYDESADIAAYKQYFVSKKIQGLALSSIELYMDTIDKFMRHVRVSFKDVTTNDIRLFLASREMSDHVGKATLARERGCITQFFKWLYEEEYIVKDPGRRVEKIRIEKRLKKAFSPLEIELMRSGADTAKEKLVLELLFSTGCRVGELVKLSLNNYDPSNDSVTVIGKGDKERTVYINPRAKVAMNTYLLEVPHLYGPIVCGRGGPGNAMSITGIQRMVKRIAARVGVGHAHPHKFRRTAATMAIRHGMPIEQVRLFLGHEDISTTLQYIDTSNYDLKIAHEKYIS